MSDQSLSLIQTLPSDRTEGPPNHWFFLPCEFEPLGPFDLVSLVVRVVVPKEPFLVVDLDACLPRSTKIVRSEARHYSSLSHIRMRCRVPPSGLVRSRWGRDVVPGTQEAHRCKGRCGMPSRRS